MKSASVAFFAILVSAEATFIVPKETQVHRGLKVVTESHEADSSEEVEQRKLFDPHAALHPPTGRSYGPAGHRKFAGQPPKYDAIGSIASLEHDIKHQLAALGENIAAARPYLSSNPALLHEAEEQLLALQHIHAGRLLHGIDSIKKLEIQQEELIQKVNAQLENSVNQLKHLAILQEEISEKQKNIPQTVLPPATLEASKKLTSQLHAIEMAKTEGERAHEIAKEVERQLDDEHHHTRVSADAGLHAHKDRNDQPIIMPAKLTQSGKSDQIEHAQISEIGA